MSFDEHEKARFWSKVDVVGENDCWLWLGAIGNAGYGDFKVTHADTSFGAHRVAYAIFAGVGMSEMKGLVVRHSCDRPRCCNPFHLATGTHADNVIDRVRRGRSAVGIGNHKLTEDEVRAIRADNRASPILASIYGVSKWTIQSVRQRTSWKHLD